MTSHKAHGAEQEIRAVFDALATALHDKDPHEVTKHFTDGSVQFTLAPPLEHIGTGADGLRAWFATWDGPIGYSIKDLAIETGGEIAFCHGLARMTGTKTDGEVVDLWFRDTICLRRDAGTWRIVHRHESVPFYMDGSYRAAVDLAPDAAASGTA